MVLAKVLGVKCCDVLTFRWFRERNKVNVAKNKVSQLVNVDEGHICSLYYSFKNFFIVILL